MTPLFSEQEIEARVAAVAKEIAARKPEIAIAILSGAFVFAADLLRALSREGLDLPIEFITLRSYGRGREASAISVVTGASENIRGRDVLLIDGVLDHGRTLLKARELLGAARSLTSVVAVDKARPDGLLRADYACFAGVEGFIVGYGMDDMGHGRGLPAIGRVD